MGLEPGALSDGDYQDLIKMYDTMSVVNGAKQVEAFINCTYKPHFEKVNGDQYHVTYTMSPVLEELVKRYRNYVTQCQKVEGGAVPMDVRDLRASILQKACQEIRQLDGGIVTDTRPKGVWEKAKRSIKACWEDQTEEFEKILEGDFGDKLASIHEAVLTWGMAPALMSQLEMVVGAEAAASIREKAEAVREFNHGMIVGEFLWAKATVEGVANLPQTVVTLAAAISERGVLPVAADMVVGIAENVSKVWKEDVVHGDARSRGRVVGRVVPDVILAVFGVVKGIKKVKAVKSAKAGTTVDTAADAVKTARLADEISDVGRTGDVLEEIKVVDKVDDVIKEGSGTLNSENNIYRNVMDTQGQRNDLPLTKEQYNELVSYAKEFGFPEENIAPYNIDSPFETGLSFGNRLYINNDALPLNLSSNNPNSLVSGKGAMAHEVVGHYETILKGTDFKTQFYDANGAVKVDVYNLALDEAQASIRAGRFAPGLTISERLTLIKDGMMRLKKQGIKIRTVRDMLDISER